MRDDLPKNRERGTLRMKSSVFSGLSGVFRSTRGRTALFVALVVVSQLFTSALLAGGCGRPRTVEDMMGRALTLKSTPRRLISLAPAYTEILFALGLGERVVGVTNFCNKPEEARDKERVGDAFNLNKEKIVSLGPDLVFVAGTPESAYVREIENLGYPVFLSNPATVDDVFSLIERIGEITGKRREARELVASMRSTLNEVSGRIVPPDSHASVFVAIDPDLWTVGPGSFVHDVITRAGAVNVLSDAKAPYLQVSMETLLERSPDAILIAFPQEAYHLLESRPGWSSLKAVKEGRVFFLDPDLVSRPGPEIVKAIEIVARALYQGEAGGK